MFTEGNTFLSGDLDLTLKVVKEFGFDLNHDSVLLDFGCGSGINVEELDSQGYQAYGCDIEFDPGSNAKLKSMIDNGIIRPIQSDPYVLPFKDNTFDLIYSHQVFEHVKNYSVTITEIARVLKPDGLCIHILPSRYRPIEVHVFVPFSSVIRNFGWLYCWAFLGIRNEFQNSMKAKEKAIINYNYLKNRTNYLPKYSLQKHFINHFNHVVFCEKEFLKYSPRGKSLYPLLKLVPFLESVYSTFWTRVILTKSPVKSY